MPAVHFHVIVYSRVAKQRYNIKTDKLINAKARLQLRWGSALLARHAGVPVSVGRDRRDWAHRGCHPPVPRERLGAGSGDRQLTPTDRHKMAGGYEPVGRGVPRGIRGAIGPVIGPLSLAQFSPTIVATPP